MTIFQDLFDAQEGQRRADEGMAQASSADRVVLWKQAANTWFEMLERGTELTADMLVAAIGLPDRGANRNNVVGAWFSGKARTGQLRFEMRMRKSARADRHVGTQRVWIKT